MAGAVEGIIENLFGGATGLNALKALFSGRVTSTRAGNLDNLTNIAAGPAALQANLGQYTDALNAATLNATVQAIEKIICDMEAQIQQLNSGPTFIGVYNANTINTAQAVAQSVFPAQTYTSSTSYGNAPNGSIVTVVSSGPPYSGSAFNYVGYVPTGWNPNMEAVANPMFGELPPSRLTTGLSLPDGGMSAQLYSPSYAPAILVASNPVATPVQIPAPGATSAANAIISGAHVALTPINGCGSSLASGVYVLANCATPDTSVSLPTYPIRLGYASGPYIGIKYHTDHHWYFVTMPTVSGAETTVNIDSLVGGSPSGNVNWPVQFFWGGQGTQASIQDANGTIKTLTGSTVPPSSAQLPLFINTMSALGGFIHAAIGYA